MITTATITTSSFVDAFFKVGPMLAEDGVGEGAGVVPPVGPVSGVFLAGGGI